MTTQKTRNAALVLVMGAVCIGAAPLAAQEGGDEDCLECHDWYDLFCSSNICHQHDEGNEYPNDENHNTTSEYPYSCDLEHGTTEECEAGGHTLLDFGMDLDEASAVGSLKTLRALVASADDLGIRLRSTEIGIAALYHCEFADTPLRIVIPVSRGLRTQLMASPVEPQPGT